MRTINSAGYLLLEGLIFLMIDHIGFINSSQHKIWTPHKMTPKFIGFNEELFKKIWLFKKINVLIIFY